MTSPVYLLNQIDLERQQVIDRGRDATTFLTMTFWADMRQFLEAKVAARQKDVENCKHGDAQVVKGMVWRWQIEKQVIEDILQYPYAAIEAARLAGGTNG